MSNIDYKNWPWLFIRVPIMSLLWIPILIGQGAQWLYDWANGHIPGLRRF